MAVLIANRFSITSGAAGGGTQDMVSASWGEVAGVLTGPTDGTINAVTSLRGQVGGVEAWRVDSGLNFLVAKGSTALGTVGIECNANGKLRATRSAGDPLQLNRLVDDGVLQGLYQDSVLEGDISVSGATVSYNGFCGGHWTQPGGKFSIPEETPRGSILSTLDEMCEWKEIHYLVGGLECKEDYNGDIPIGGTLNKKVSYQILKGEHDSPERVEEVVIATVFDSPKENYVKTKLSHVENDPRVYAVFATYDKDGDITAHAVGASVVRVQGPVTGGDLITSSKNPGVGKVQSDHLIKSYTIAKCTHGNPSTGIVTVPCILLGG